MAVELAEFLFSDIFCFNFSSNGRTSPLLCHRFILISYCPHKDILSSGDPCWVRGSPEPVTDMRYHESTLFANWYSLPISLSLSPSSGDYQLIALHWLLFLSLPMRLLTFLARAALMSSNKGVCRAGRELMRDKARIEWEGEWEGERKIDREKIDI